MEDQLEKVIQPEKTKHKPVLMEQVLQYLQPEPNKVYIDATLGGGGHTRMILNAEPTCIVIGFDWDKAVIDTTGEQIKQEFPDRFFPIWGNFSKVDQLLKKNKIQIS